MLQKMAMCKGQREGRTGSPIVDNQASDNLKKSDCDICCFCYDIYSISPAPKNFNTTISLEWKGEVFSSMKIPSIISNVNLNHSDFYTIYPILLSPLNLIYIWFS